MILYNFYHKVLITEINHHEGDVISPIRAYNITFSEHINELQCIKNKKIHELLKIIF